MGCNALAEPGLWVITGLEDLPGLRRLLAAQRRAEHAYSAGLIVRRRQAFSRSARLQAGSWNPPPRNRSVDSERYAARWTNELYLRPPEPSGSIYRRLLELRMASGTPRRGEAPRCRSLPDAAAGPTRQPGERSCAGGPTRRVRHNSFASQAMGGSLPAWPRRCHIASSCVSAGGARSSSRIHALSHTCSGRLMTWGLRRDAT